MELFKNITHINFMGLSKWTTALSVSSIAGSLLILALFGLNFGLDFTGGTQLEVRFSKAIPLEQVRETLSAASFHEAKISHYGSSQDVLVRLANKPDVSEKELKAKVIETLEPLDTAIELRRVEYVGSEVGEELAEKGSLAVLLALLATMIYIALRFEYRFGVSAAVALMHDPIIILGIFSLFQVEFDLATLAGILAVLGYSLNDTIVVFDRVRENFRKMRVGSPREIMDLSINQTLSRTIMTSGSTLLVVIALYLFGGSSLHGFSLALLIGILVGTYSSIFVAGALALKLGLSKKDLLREVKTEVDELP